MKSHKNIFLVFFILLIVVLPFISLAQGQTSTSGSLVPCDGLDCDFKKLIQLVNNVINFILFIMVVPIAAIMFAYAGFLLLTSGGEASQKTKAKKIFANVGIGFIIAVASWLIINLLLTLLGYDGSWIGFK
jgi:hypothetical protein